MMMEGIGFSVLGGGAAAFEGGVTEDFSWRFSFCLKILTISGSLGVSNFARMNIMSKPETVLAIFWDSFIFKWLPKTM